MGLAGGQGLGIALDRQGASGTAEAGMEAETGMRVGTGQEAETGMRAGTGQGAEPGTPAGRARTDAGQTPVCDPACSSMNANRNP